jgi:glycosyltransferase involved in cell wall biosynthesis
MNIAFLSYEYPLETGLGGIGTYVYQIAKLFSERGIGVHVVCGSFGKDRSFMEHEHLTIHLVNCRNREEFKIVAPPRLLSVHEQSKLDLVEAPDYGAESINIKSFLPKVPLVVKFHVPSYLVKKLNDFYFDRRIDRRIKHLFVSYNYQKDEDYKAAIQADYFLTPSLSLGDIISKDWKIDRNQIIHAPNPYTANERLLEISPETTSSTILYLGRLETRKGVYNLSKVVPLVLKEVPAAKFIFLGKDDRSPWRKNSMKELMMEQIGAYKKQVQFLEKVDLFEIPKYLSQASICVIPSLWDNFPNVCLEAMASARGIVASKNGGMSEMLSSINGKFLVDPHNVKEISSAITFLLKNDQERISYARDCRRKVIEYYSDKLVDELIHLYQNLINSWV